MYLVVARLSDHAVSLTRLIHSSALSRSPITSLVTRRCLVEYTVADCCCVEGVLDLGPSASSINIDMHLFDHLNVTASISAMAIGYENGDLSAMMWWCKVYDNCTDSSMVASAVRDSSTGFDLVYYGTSSNGTSKVRDTSTVLLNANAYTATATSWYHAAKKSGRESATSRYGNPISVPVDIFAGMSEPSGGVAQAIYDASFSLVGVVVIRYNFGDLSLELQTRSPSATSKSSTVQKFGEVLASSDLVVNSRSSEGLSTFLNVTTSGMGNVASYATSLFQTNLDLSTSQNQTEISGLDLQCTRPAGTWTVEYPSVLGQRLTSWTTLLVIPREVYYDSLDRGTELNFVVIVFSFTAMTYIAAIAFGSIGMESSTDGLADLPYHPKNSELALESNQLHVGVIDGANSEISTCSSGDPQAVLTSYNKAIQSYRPLLNLEEEIRHAQQHPNLYTTSLRRDRKNDESLIMHALMEHQLIPVVDSWGLDPESTEFKERAISKSIEILEVGNSRIDALFALSVEAKFGQGSWQQKLFNLNFHAWSQNILAISYALFIGGAFITSESWRTTWDLVSLLPYTINTIVLLYLERKGRHGSCSRTTTFNILINVLLWGTFFLVNSVDNLGENTGFLMLHDLLRPWMLISKSFKVQAAMRLMGLSIYNARRIFFFFFTVISLCAVVVNLLFHKEFDHDKGESVDTFLDAFVYMFIFMTSGDNW